MINTLLEHVSMKMEVKSVAATENLTKGNSLVTDNIKDSDETVETDEEIKADGGKDALADVDEDEEDDDDDDEDEEESDIESDALEIEQEATLLISSDEEAELEAQRIRFPDIILPKKSRKDSNKSSRSSSRNSHTSTTSSATSRSKPEQKLLEVIVVKNSVGEENNTQRTSPCINNTESNKSAESDKQEDKSNTVVNKRKSTECMKLECNKNCENKSKTVETTSDSESCENVENNKNTENNRNIENLTKSPNNPVIQKSRRESNNSTCSVASSLASDIAESESCGNIYIFNLQQKLIFNCEFCDLKYGDLENFGRHLHEAHKVFNFDEDPEKENAPRNVRKSNRLPNNSNNGGTPIKKEPLQCIETLPAEPPVALPLSVLAEPLDSCGNVFMQNHRKMSLVCRYCESKYANLELFEKHLRQQHHIFEGCRNEANVTPKVEVKEEVFIITEVVEKSQSTVPQAVATIPLDINITSENDAKTTTTFAETMETNIVPSITPKTSNPSSVEINIVETPVVESKLPKEITVAAVVSLSNVCENLECAPDTKKTPPKKSTRKRCVPAVQTSPSPNKLPKRVTRNATKSIQPEISKVLIEATEGSQNVETSNVPVIIAETVQTKEMTISSEVAETKKTIKSTESNKSTQLKLTESVKLNEAETEENKEAVLLKSSEPTESKKATPQKLVEPAESKNITIKSASPIESKKPSKKTTPKEIVETMKAAQLKSAEAKKAVSTETKATKRLTETIDTRKSSESKSKKSIRVEATVLKKLSEKETVDTKKLSIQTQTQTQTQTKTETETKPKKTKPPRRPTAKRKSVNKKKKTQVETIEKELVDQEVVPEPSLPVLSPLPQPSTTTTLLQSSSEIAPADEENDTSTVAPTTAASEQAKKRRRTIKTKVEKENAPSPDAFAIPSPPPPPILPQVEQHIQVRQLPQEPQHFEDALLQDLNADPVNEIIEQIQNEFLQNEQRQEQEENAQPATVTFTINSVEESKLINKPTQNVMLSIKTQPNDLNSPEDIKPFLIQNVKRFVCDQCPRSFKKHVRLVEHKRLHTGEKPFACDECGKQFRIRMRLNEHKLRHSKEKKFKCEICGLACCTKQDLNLHMRHHTNDRRFQCSMCPKAFVRSSDLKIHVRVHTGEKPYMCDVCHKCFRANQNLSVHKKSHMGEASKTYKCEHCDKKFMRNIDRKVHMRSHTGEKPYKCEICQRGYSSKFNVRAHIERDHMAANGSGTPPRGKKKPGPKPKALREELAKQKKLIEELQQQLLQQIKTDEKIIPSVEEIPLQDSLQDCTIARSSPTSTNNDPIQSAYDLLNQLKSNTTTSKPLTIIPSPPPMPEPTTNPFTKAKKASSTLLPLTITQKIEQHSPASTSSSSVSCLTTPSPPKATATKVVSQKTSLGIQQVSVTVSMQVENVTPNTGTSEKENSVLVTTSSSSATSVKKERKITSYFTVVGQKAEV